MAPPNRRTSSVDLDVIKKGCLIKSPPSYIINNQKSWKRRLFKLCKSTENIYTFRYYSYGIKEEFKREIFISDVHDIKHGSQLKEEELELPFRVCGCTSAHNILFIKTKKRDFFLFDENKEEIEDWHRCLIEAWKHTNQVTLDQLKISSPRLEVNPEKLKKNERYSYPTNRPSTGIVMTDDSQRERSKTDPVNLMPTGMWPFTSDNTEIINNHPVQQKTLVRQEPIPETHDSVIDPESGDEYDFPRYPPVKRCSCSSTSSGLQEPSDTESEDSAGVYEHMDSVCSPQAEVCQETSTTFKESGSKNNRNKGSQVHRMAIIKLKYEQTDPADLEKKEINVLTEHLKNYLTIEEIGERLCVAKWKGPREIGCLFRHGDHIDAMNDIWLNDKNLFYQLLNMSVNKEVRLSVISNKKADTFHMLGCSCV